MRIIKHYIRSTKNFYTVNFNGIVIYFSYSTPVAIQDGDTLYVSHNYWSTTTGKHLFWIEDSYGRDYNLQVRKGKRLSSKEFTAIRNKYGIPDTVERLSVA